MPMYPSTWKVEVEDKFKVILSNTAILYPPILPNPLPQPI